jgi:ribose 5-phosphate isomerase A
MESRSSDERLAAAAVSLVSDGAVVGLGTGRAATAFLHSLAERVRRGLRVRGVPTSLATESLARRLGVSLVHLDDVEAIDITVDGADEVDPGGNLIKGLGGAMVREKIVAAESRRLVILVGREKLVDVLGRRGVLPVEVVPFGLAWCRRRLEKLGFPCTPRLAGEVLLTTDNGNHVLDCRVPALDDPAGVEASLLAIPGVVGTGLFLGMKPTVLVDQGDRVEVACDV